MKQEYTYVYCNIFYTDYYAKYGVGYAFRKTDFKHALALLRKRLHADGFGPHNGMFRVIGNVEDGKTYGTDAVDLRSTSDETWRCRVYFINLGKAVAK